VIPLPFANHPHADGLIRHVALVSPRDTLPEDQNELAAAVARWTKTDDTGGLLRLAGGQRLRVKVVETTDNISASPRTWCRSSATWTTITPIVLDRFPKHFFDDDPGRRARADEHAAATIARACELIGLPRPTAVMVSRDPLVRGTSPVAAFPAFRRRSTGSRPLSVHAEITFDEPVHGPLIVGAGRYLGYGLCAPSAATARPLRAVS